MGFTYTTNYNLAKPDSGQTPFHAEMNANLDTIDAKIQSASVSSLTFSLPLQKTATNVELNLGNNVRLVGNNLETIQNIRITDGPQFAGIQLGDAVNEWLYIANGTGIIQTLANYQLHSASAFIIGTSTLVGQELTHKLNVLGGTKLGNAFSNRHNVTGSMYLTGSVWSLEGKMWTRGNTVWGNSLNHGQTYISGNAYVGQKIMMNGPLYLSNGIVSASGGSTNQTASWEDAVGGVVTKADDSASIYQDSGITPPSGTPPLILFVSGAALFKGQVEIQGNLTSSNGALQYDADTGQLSVTSVSIDGKTITSDGSGISIASSASFNDITASTVLTDYLHVYNSASFGNAVDVFEIKPYYVTNTYVTELNHYGSDVYIKMSDDVPPGNSILQIKSTTQELTSSNLTINTTVTNVNSNLYLTGSSEFSGSIKRKAKTVGAFHGNIPSAPSADVVDGDFYYDTSAGRLYMRANSSWIQIN